MTREEEHTLLEAIKKNAPEWYDRIRHKHDQKRDLILSCIGMAGTDNPDYQAEINRQYNSCQVRLNETETVLLNFICLIKHKEFLNNGIDKDDQDIRKWLNILIQYTDNDSSVISLLGKQANKMIDAYKVKNPPGRPKGTGKQTFQYDGKEYRTIQECADDYGITRQGMFKKLRKLHII